MAEIELSVLRRQGPDRRIPDAAALTQEVATWEQARNADHRPVNWRFTPPMLAASSSPFTRQFRTGEAPAHRSWFSLAIKNGEMSARFNVVTNLPPVSAS